MYHEKYLSMRESKNLCVGPSDGLTLRLMHVPLIRFVFVLIFYRINSNIDNNNNGVC